MKRFVKCKDCHGNLTCNALSTLQQGCFIGVTTDDIIQAIEQKINSLDRSIKKLKDHFIILLDDRDVRLCVQCSRCWANVRGKKCEIAYSLECGEMRTIDIKQALHQEIEKRQESLGRLLEQKANISAVESEAERQEVQNYIKEARILSEPYVFSGIKSWKRYRQVYGTIKSFTDATAEIIQEADGMLKPEVNNHKHMSTFLCENCCEAVQVPTDLLGKELRFKCPVCHQENHYDLTAE